MKNRIARITQAYHQYSKDIGENMSYLEISRRMDERKHDEKAVKAEEDFLKQQGYI